MVELRGDLGCGVLMEKCEDFGKEVLEYDGFVLVDFYADWCGPCRLLVPVLEELSNEMQDVKFIKVNVEQHREAAASYGVNSIPHLALFKGGKCIASRVGGDSKSRIEGWIKENIA